MEWKTATPVTQAEMKAWPRDVQQEAKAMWDRVIPVKILRVSYAEFKNSTDEFAKQVRGTYDSATQTTVIITRKDPSECDAKETDRMRRYMRWINAGFQDIAARQYRTLSREEVMERVEQTGAASTRAMYQQVIDHWDD